MGPADDQAEQRWFKVGLSEHRGVNVTPQVIDAGEGNPPGRGQAFSHTGADQQTSHQARTAGGGDQGEI